VWFSSIANKQNVSVSTRVACVWQRMEADYWMKISFGLHWYSVPDIRHLQKTISHCSQSTYIVGSVTAARYRLNRTNQFLATVDLFLKRKREYTLQTVKHKRESDWKLLLNCMRDWVAISFTGNIHTYKTGYSCKVLYTFSLKQKTICMHIISR